MALLYFNLNILDNYKLLIKDIIKYLTIIIVFHYLIISTGFKNPIEKKFLNKNFIRLVKSLVLSILFYHLIMEELIQII